MTIRNPIPNGTGAAVRTALNLRTKSLFDAAQFPLTAIGGTANAVTASLAPALDGDGLLDGMTFTLTWGAANTGGVTLAINGGSPVPVLSPNGLALPAASVGDGLRSQITYIGGDFVMLSPTLLSGGAGGVRYSFTFTASGTWTKPTDLPDATPVTIQLWAGGGGGASNNVINAGGGGGGGFAQRIIRAEDLGATVTVTIGAGGAAGAVGGNSTFGAVLTAYGGGFGAGAAASGESGGGGGEVTAGATLIGGAIGGGDGTSTAVTVGGNAKSIYGGGAGGTSTANGGAAAYGGGGGNGTGGVSAYGGNGGATSAAGNAPAGGGGRGSSGARGECRVWI